MLQCCSIHSLCLLQCCSIEPVFVMVWEYLESVFVAVFDFSRDQSLPVEASDPLERWDSYEDFNNITQDSCTEGE